MERMLDAILHCPMVKKEWRAPLSVRQFLKEQEFISHADDAAAVSRWPFLVLTVKFIRC